MASTAFVPANAPTLSVQHVRKQLGSFSLRSIIHTILIPLLLTFQVHEFGLIILIASQRNMYTIEKVVIQKFSSVFEHEYT